MYLPVQTHEPYTKLHSYLFIDRILCELKASFVACLLRIMNWLTDVLWYEPWHDKTNKVTVRPAKTQISLGIRPVWSVYSVRMKKAWVLSYPLSPQRRLWSWRLAHSHFVGFVCRSSYVDWHKWTIYKTPKIHPNTVQKYWTTIFVYDIETVRNVDHSSRLYSATNICLSHHE